MSAPQVLDQMIADTTINGQPVDIDKEFGGQCWDLVELFAERCGVPKATSPRPWAIPLGTNGYAKEAWTQYDNSPHMQEYFDKVLAGQQQKGDITVYDGHGDYVEGHIAISLGGNEVFEENADPDGSPAHVYASRSSAYLLGALRIKGGTMATDSVTKQELEILFQRFNGVPPNQNDKNKFVGASLDSVLQYLTTNPTGVAYTNQISAALDGSANNKLDQIKSILNS